MSHKPTLLKTNHNSPTTNLSPHSLPPSAYRSRLLFKCHWVVWGRCWGNIFFLFLFLFLLLCFFFSLVVCFHLLFVFTCCLFSLVVCFVDVVVVCVEPCE